jgi:uncharacterized protein (TIGR03435 family)
MDLLAGALNGIGDVSRPVVDQTGLNGKFDFSIEWAPEPKETPQLNREPSGNIDGPTFVTALREQLGVKLEATKAPLQVLVIDHVERPTEN